MGMDLSARDMVRIATIIQREAGIHMPASKTALVGSRLSKRVRALGLKDFGAYCALVENDRCADGRHERNEMISALTTNVTGFFRESHHFEEFAEADLPALVKRVADGGRIRIWSAGCSTGEEPYSIALTLLAHSQIVSKENVQILATDIDEKVLAVGRTARYPASAMKDIPSAAAPYLVKSGAHCEIGSAARDMVEFRRLNLIGDWSLSGQFDAIFCRNVMIYFERPTQERLLTRFASALPQNARLFLGHSERVGSSLSHLFAAERVTSYRRL